MSERPEPTPYDDWMEENNRLHCELEEAKEYGSDMANEVVSLKAQLEAAKEEIERLKEEDAAKDDKMLDMEGRYIKQTEKLRADLETYRNYVGSNMAYSDYRTVDEMRAALEAAKAEIHKLKNVLRGIHRVECNHSTQEIGGPGCVCKLVNKNEDKTLRAEVENNNRDKIEYAKIISQLTIEVQQQKERVEAWKKDYDKISEQLQIVQDERARSFDMLKKKVGKCGLTVYQAEVDLEIGFRIDAIKADLATAVEQIDNLKTLLYMLEDRHHPDSEWCEEAKEVLG